MVVEMTAVKLLQPWFGSTNHVWANVIAVVLAALSVGYWAGGRLAEKRPTPVAYFVVVVAGGLLVTASAPFATPVASSLQPGTADLEGVVGILVRGSLAASLVLFAPAMVVLGAVSPYAVRLLATAGAGRAAGRVFAVSTLGSLLGTYLATFWLGPEYGSRMSVLAAAGMLLLPGLVGLVWFGRARGGAVAAAAVILAAPAAAFTETDARRGAPPLRDGGVAHVLDERETPYQFVTVRRDVYPTQTERLLTINEGVYTYHSFQVEGRILTNSRYYDDYSLLPLLLDVEEGATLRGAVVGLACGITARQWRHFWEGPYRVEVDGAEIDPVVLELGRKRFGLPPADAPWLRAYEMDGRRMLAGLPADRRYHMIVVDAFANELYIPFHLATREFFRLCRDRLVPGGLVAMNVYATQADAPNLLAIENTLADAFGACWRVRQSWGGNYLLLARRGEEPPELARLVPSRIEERWGRRAEVAEWSDLVALASRVPWHARRVVPNEETIVLTDDHCPLERLTDDFLDRLEREVLGR
jgi:spermidine synthase